MSSAFSLINSIRRFALIGTLFSLALMSIDASAVKGPRLERLCKDDFGRLGETQKRELRERIQRSAKKPTQPLEVKVEHKPNGQIHANGVMITGDGHYPLSIVKDALGLDEKALDRFSPSANILSLGEGMSDLMPSLRDKYRNAKALDIWYDQKRLPFQLEDYAAYYRSSLITGSATDIPLPSRSQDLVLSHALLTNLEPTQIDESVFESVRVLKAGGEARHAFAAFPSLPH